MFYKNVYIADPFGHIILSENVILIIFNDK